MKKLLLLFVTTFLPLVASADAVEIDGIYYNLVPKAKQAEVTSNPSMYSGDITIPESFIYDGVPYDVTSIGDEAFRSCSGLTSIAIPNSVTSIGSYAFYYCSGLTSLDIPNSVTSIGEGAFERCRGLTSVTISNSVTSIGNSTFLLCSKLTSVIIPNSVTSIGKWAFQQCSELTSIVIPNSVKSVGKSAFTSCDKLNMVICSDVGAWCGISFEDRYSNPLLFSHHLFSDYETEITELVIPSSVTSIGYYAFYGCSGLTSVTIPNSVTSIDGYAFYTCSGLTSVTIPNSVTTIGDYAFYGCSSLASVTIPNSVTSIGRSVFYNCSGMASVTIPNSVTSIGMGAFSGCTGLTSIDIPNSVTSIGSQAFSGCSKMASISIGSGITKIGGEAFTNCTDLADVYCNAESVPTTQSSAFENSYIDYATLHVPTSSVDAYKATEPWSGFKEVVAIEEELPESVTAEIGGVYYNLKPKEKLAEVTSNPSKYSGAVTIPESVTYKGVTYDVTSIGEEAFRNCSGLTSITIPNSVTSIGKLAFSVCTSLTSIVIPNSVTSIERSTFIDCQGLTSVTIGNSVTSIGICAFYDCSSLTSVTIPNSVTSLGDYAFSVCAKLTSVTLSNSVTTIGKSAFSGCTSLTSIDIPNSVTSIGEGAFGSCESMISVTIGNSVTSIGSSAFYGCSSLTSVTVDIDTPLSIDSYTFSNRANATLYVPKGYKSAYEAADYWKEFKEIIALEEELPESVTAEIGGVYYNLKPKEKLAEVTSNPSKYSGAVTIPETVVYKGVTCNVTSIGESAFYGCIDLTSITIPNSVTSISDFAFYSCRGLTSLTIPTSVISIGIWSFFGCNGLTSVVIPNSVTTINSYAFLGCTSLTSIDFPNSVTSIGPEAFENTGWLNNQPDGLVYLGKIAYNYKGTMPENTHLILDEGTLVIANLAFYNCIGLTSIDIPNSVTHISGSAFLNCSGLTEVTIPNSVTTMGGWAFYGCSSLTVVTVDIESPLSIDERTFTNRANATLYVPKGCKAAYEAADYWKEFKEIKEIEPAETKCATPTISFVGGMLHFECETEGVTYHYSVTTPVIEDGTNNNVVLPSSYTVRVYATKDGLTDSDVATKEIDIRGKKGDVNEDGQVTITDAVGVVDIILNAKE